MSLFLYRTVCDNGDVSSVWGEDEPTVCPMNSMHAITDTAIIDEREEYVYEFMEVKGITGGHFQTFTKKIPGVANSTTSNDYSWKRPISVTSINFVTTVDHEGDFVSIIIAPDTLVGVLTSPTTIGDEILNVSSTVIDNSKIGFHIKVTDGVNVDDLGEIINMGDTTVNVENPLSHVFAAGSYIQMSIVPLDRVEIGPPANIVIGESTIGGSDIPGNTIIRVVYEKTNDNNTALLTRLETKY